MEIHICINFLKMFVDFCVISIASDIYADCYEDFIGW